MNTDSSGLGRKMQVEANWTTFDELPLSGESIAELFANTTPAVRYPRSTSTEERARLVDIIKRAQVVSRMLYLRKALEILPSRRYFNCFETLASGFASIITWRKNSR